MSDRDEARRARAPWPGAAALARLLLGAVIGGAGGTIAALVVLHQPEERGWLGGIDLARAIGLARGTGGTDAAREGLAVLIAVAVLLGAVVLLGALAVGRGRLVIAAPLTALVIFAAWGLVCAPYLASRIDDYTIGGIFGADGGPGVAIAFGLAAAGYGLVAARIATVMAGADFWEPKDNDIRKGLERLEELGLVVSPSLELPEQRSEQRGDPARGEPGPR